MGIAWVYIYSRNTETTTGPQASNKLKLLVFSSSADLGILNAYAFHELGPEWEVYSQLARQFCSSHPRFILTTSSELAMLCLDNSGWPALPVLKQATAPADVIASEEVASEMNQPLFSVCQIWGCIGKTGEPQSSFGFQSIQTRFAGPVGGRIITPFGGHGFPSKVVR